MDGIKGGRQQGPRAANAAAPNGVNGLVQMALIILSAVPNSAATEWVFSQFGIIHSKYHNHMHPDKVHKITLVKADIAQEFGIPKRSKQKFASLENFEQDDNEVNPPPLSTPTPPVPAPAPAPTTPTTASAGDENDVAAQALPHQHLFLATAGELMQEAGDEDNEAKHEPQMPLATTSSHIQASAPPTTSNNDPMSLAALFHYPDHLAISATTRQSLAEFWRYGEARLCNKEAFHEFVHANPSESNNPDV